jgi:hypothetical protein
VWSVLAAADGGNIIVAQVCALFVFYSTRSICFAVVRFRLKRRQASCETSATATKQVRWRRNVSSFPGLLFQHLVNDVLGFNKSLGRVMKCLENLLRIVGWRQRLQVACQVQK